MAPTPGGQHVVVVSTNGDPQLWHVMSNSLTHTFKGNVFIILLNIKTVNLVIK